MQHWLMKSEPSTYSIDDLQQDKTTLWEGVRNYQARNFFRDAMQRGDRALFYHSNTARPGVVGEMEVIDPNVIDPFQFDKTSQYFDEKSHSEKPRWLAPKMRYICSFKSIVTLDALKAATVMTSSPLVRKGNRLSVLPLTKRQYDFIKRRGE